MVQRADNQILFYWVTDAIGPGPAPAASRSAGAGLAATHRSRDMLAFAIRRLLEAAFVMVTVALLAFVLFRFVGDPVNQMVGQDTSLEDRQRLRAGAGPQRSGRRAVRPLRGQRRALRFRHLLPDEAAGDDHHLRARAGHPRAGLRGRAVRHRARHPDGRLHRHPPRQLAVEGLPHRVADRHLAADLPDRHPADLRVRRDARRAAVLRPRRGGAHRLLAHGAADDLRPQGADPAGGDARPLPDDAGDAAGALRDAGGAAHRLHQVRPRARAHRSAPSTSAMR